MQYHWLIEAGECSWSKAHASCSHPAVHNVSKVYHLMIRLINGTAVERRTWLKCKYPKCKWLDWIIGNYKVSSWDLSDVVNGGGGDVHRWKGFGQITMWTVICWLMSLLTEIRINFTGQVCFCMQGNSSFYWLLMHSSKNLYSVFR